MSGERGSSVLEALIAAAIAGVAASALAATGADATRAVRLARQTGDALTAATDRLEALRATARGDGNDRVSARDGTPFARQWTVEAGRGTADRLEVEVRWSGRRLRLATRAFP
jgi:Tfp pilus assembly protein PilV